jgi:hypothetical protein
MTAQLQQLQAAMEAEMETVGPAIDAISEIIRTSPPPTYGSGASLGIPAAGATPAQPQSATQLQQLQAAMEAEMETVGPAIDAISEIIRTSPPPTYGSGASVGIPGGGGASGGTGGGGSGLVQTMPWIQARPWIVAELPESTPSPPSSQPAAQPQIIRPQLPSGPDYPTAPQPTTRPSPQPASNIPAPSTFNPQANTWAFYPSVDEWRTMTDAERMGAIREAAMSQGIDPNRYTPEQWVRSLDAFNQSYGMGANPVSWPSASDWRSMNEAQRIEFIRQGFAQQGYDPDLVSSDLARQWLEYYNTEYYYSAEYQQWLAQGAAFEAGDIQGYLDLGGTLTTVALEAIYDDGYDPFAANGTVPYGLSAAGAQQPAIPWLSLSSAGMSLTSVGNSLSLAGSMTPSSAGWTPAVNWYSQSAVGNSLAINWGGGQSLAGNSLSLAGGFTSLNGAFGTPVTLAGAGSGAWGGNGGYQQVADPTGALSQFTAGGQLVGFLADLTQDEITRILATNGAAGLDRLLAQPFNVLLVWGPGAYDIDLHMTGPDANGGRFHIYYAAPGSLTSTPYAQLIRDCICTSGSEVILTTQLIQGGVYRISAFNFGDQSPTSTNLSNQGQLQLMIVRGGVATSAGNGTTIEGGRVIFTGSPQTGQAGNTWIAVEIDPSTGQIRFVNQITNSSGSGGVSAPVTPIPQAALPPVDTLPRANPAPDTFWRRIASDFSNRSMIDVR